MLDPLLRNRHNPAFIPRSWAKICRHRHFTASASKAQRKGVRNERNEAESWLRQGVIDGFTGVDIAARPISFATLPGRGRGRIRARTKCSRTTLWSICRIAYRTMNELYRVLKAGARATIETPNAARGCGYYHHRTLSSPWCLSTFKYFEYGAFAHTRLAKSYGITAAFRIVLLEEQKRSGKSGARWISWVRLRRRRRSCGFRLRAKWHGRSERYWRRSSNGVLDRDTQPLSVQSGAV